MQLKQSAGVSRFETGLSLKEVDRPGRTAAFTLMEIVVVLALLLMLTIAAISALTLLDRSSMRQAQHTTAIEAAQGRLDQILSEAYVTPSTFFNSSNYTSTTNVTLTLAKSGSTATTMAVLTTRIEPAVNGHVATVVIQYTNYSQPTSIRLQTLINRLSGGQP